MKRILTNSLTTLGALAFLLLLFHAAPLHAGGNILVNGDIKEEKEGVPVGWTSGPASDKDEVPNATYSSGKDPTDPKHRKTVSIDYKSGIARALWRLSVPKDDVPKKIKPGKKYEFSFWLRYELAEPPPKGSSPITARCNVWGSDFEGIAAPLLTPSGGYDQAAAYNALVPQSDAPVAPVKAYVQGEVPQKMGWTEMKVVFQLPASTNPPPAAVQVYVAISAKGQLWADNFKLVEVPDDTPITIQ